MRVVFLPPASRYLKKLKDRALKKKFQDKVDEICDDPNIGEMKRGDLAGIRSCDIYHNGTNYELAYRVVYDEDETVVVIMAGTRENFYNALKQYIKA